MNNRIGLDFETYGDVDLPKYGMDRYIAGKYFTPTLASTYHVDDNGTVHRNRFDFVQDYYESARTKLLEVIEGKQIVAHNAPFEQAVLKWMGRPLSHRRFIDSAVVARVAGAGSRLEQAAPQLLGIDKMEEGRALIKLFAIPGKLQEANGTDEFDPDIVSLYPQEWSLFGDYCDLDAELGYRIVHEWGWLYTDQEHEYAAITSDMNDVGWRVDLDTVHEMQRRYKENQRVALADFHDLYADGVSDPLNFNSFKQQKEFCLERGVKARSFDEDHVAKLLTAVTRKLEQGTLPYDKQMQLEEVKKFLLTKQILGGSSLSKLQKIIDLVGDGDRLRGQYLHVGAAATLRTSGKGVQMQNLKRLTTPADMSELDDPDAEWSNDELAVNLRQVFTASHPQGALIVGDFSSVESRGLAMAAGARWKVDAFFAGKDMYKVLAAKIDRCDYDDVTKARRQFGKVGELSCGYQAGAGAVQSFAAKMGTELTEAEAGQLVSDWRATNPEVEALWETLDQLLREVVVGGIPVATRIIGIGGYRIRFERMAPPPSLLDLHKDAVSVRMQLFTDIGEAILSRVFHGCYVRGRDVGYYKPAKNKTGAPWVNHYRHPKTGAVVYYKLYGGKLTGTLVQSMCREMFFHSLKVLTTDLYNYDNVQIVGQFHDEIVLDWQPPTPAQKVAGTYLTLDEAKAVLEKAMTDPGRVRGFPLAADIKHDYRYTK
jgi:hypothetical protein